MSIAQNVATIKQNIAQAAIAAGRDPKDILLCAATKMNNADAVRQAIAAGVDCCGENRVQELTAKLAEKAYAGAPIHFIGRLQTNKVKQVVGRVSLIQSVDRLKLLQAIQTEAARQGIVQDILLEINIGREESKGGFLVEELPTLLPKMGEFPNIFVRGLMAIPPICKISSNNDKFFHEMCNLSVDISSKKYDNVCVDILSMGMSDDYESAIRCGSTMIRVGTAIFGARDYTKPHPRDVNIQEEK
ncbi:MAG: YggS family pyridoxal phosphate-dependent enzyme [Oscillospiraceae bacterium]|nr:YggS family pyridoxal phosphate-dependent enzyme [Oscillospiraceae bacterium]